MAATLGIVETIFSDTVNDVTSNANNWMSFMKCASMNYKYDFSDQLLIYAQKPNAIACADFNTWNNELKRYINKGAKGIALVDYSSGRERLRYVWDISDTHSIYGTKGKK